jgi:hypothetical protein
LGPEPGAGVLVAAAGKVLGALVALPRQLVSLVRPEAAWPSGPPDPTPRAETEPERVPGIGRWVIGSLWATVANAAALILVFAAARAVYYPFWAAGASRDELDRSWGGPGAVGATLAHRAVAAATIAVMYALILLMEAAGGADDEVLSRSELAGGHPRRERPA